MAIGKIQRWLDLLALLTRNYHQGASRSQIMEGVPAYAQDLAAGKDTESVRRKFERDKQELIAFGIPLETLEPRTDEPDEQAVYRLRSKDFYLPYLKLLRRGWEVERREDAPSRSSALPLLSMEVAELDTYREAVSWLRDLPGFPLREEAASAYRKLTFDLEDTVLAPAQTPPGPLVAQDDPEAVSHRTALLTDAMERRKEVTFTYQGAYRDATTRRRVHPYGLLFKFNHWYLVGHDVDREAPRIFRLSRMDDLEVNTSKPGTPDFQRPQDFTLEPWRSAHPWSLPSDDDTTVDVLVRFHFPQSLLVARRELGERVSDEPGGAQLRRFRVRQMDAFLRWLLTRQGEAEPLEPPEVVGAFRELARKVADLYAAAPAGGDA